MPSLNKVILIGNITRDIELRKTPAGVSVIEFGIAVQRRFKANDGSYPTDFFNIVAWRNTADFGAKYFKKGNPICVVGSLQNRSWEKDGTKHTVTEVIADELNFVGGKSEVDGTPRPDVGYTPSAEDKPKESNFETLSIDDSLPF